MLKKRGIAIMMAGLMAVSTLAGCGSTQTTDGEGQRADGSKTEAKVESDKEIVLKVLDSHAYGLEEYDTMAKKFEEEHPGVKIDVQHVSNGYTTTLQSRVNSGDIPDVFNITSGTVARMYYEFAYDWTEDAEAIDKFSPEALAVSTDENGRVMGLPWQYENMGLIYNKDLFEKAGITELPVTMDELEEACKKLEDIGCVPIALAAKENFVLRQLSTHFMMDKELDAKGTVDAIMSGELIFNNMPHWNNFFRFLDLALEYGPNKPLEVDWEISENMVANGEAAIMHMGDWCQAALDSFNPDANLGFLPVPVGDSKEDCTLLSSLSWIYLVNKDSENLELAKEYAAYILSSEAGLDWICDGVGAVPGAKTDRAVSGTLASDAKQYIERKETNGWIHSIAPANFSEVCGPLVQAYMGGDMSAEEVTEGFQDFWIAGY